MTATPELSITFTEPKTRIYEPGDAVSGAAIFIPLFSARLRSLEVSLQGYCYTSSLGANAKVSHTVPFLHLSTSTLEEKYTYIGERYEAPFSFIFPKDTDVEHEAGPEKLKPLFSQGLQLLPSSVVISARNCVQTVRYVIEVEIYGRKRAVCEETVLFRQSSADTLERRQSVLSTVTPWAENPRRTSSIATIEPRRTSISAPIEPRRESVVPYQKPRRTSTISLSEEVLQDLISLDGEDDACDPLAPTSPLLNETWGSNKAMYYNRPETIRISDELGAPQLSLHALPMITTHHKGAKDRYRHAKVQNEGPLSWVFKPWKTPKVVFMPSICCPQSTPVGQEIPFLLAVDTIKNPVWQGRLQESQLLLEEFSLAVTAHSRTIMQNRPHKRRWGRCLELSYAVLEATGLSAPMNTDNVPIPLMQNFKILPGTIPSFSTYTMSRGYSIDVYLKFSFGGQKLEWGASLNLEVTANDSIPLAEGTNMDPLLFIDPKREPQYYFRSHIEAGAAESTSRNNIYPGNPDDAVNTPGNQWETGHGRLPRTSYACASGQIKQDLLPVKAARGKGSAFNVVAGICGKPSRRYMKELEPMIAPLYTFKEGLGLDGSWTALDQVESRA